MDIIIESSSDEDFIPILATIIFGDDKVKKKKRTHKYWVRPWIAERHNKSENNTMFKLQLQLINVGIIYLCH